MKAQSSKELQMLLQHLKDCTKRSIVTILTENNVKEVDLMQDNDGHDWDDVDYDSDFVETNRIWCNLRHEKGYISQVSIQGEHEITALLEGDEYTYVITEDEMDAELLLSILERLEKVRFKPIEC